MSKKKFRIPILPMAVVLVVILAVSLLGSLFGGKPETGGEEIVAEGIAYLESLERKDPADVTRVRQQIYQAKIDAQRDLNLPMDDQKIFWYSTENKEIMDGRSPMWEGLIAPILRGCTAVVCYNDQVANPLVEFLTAQGIHIPRQMAVVSFDNSFYSSLSSRRITSLSHGEYNVGRIAAETLIQLFEGKEVHSQTVPWVLMEKESS